MDNETIETRSYRILGVLGKGGFGKVYRARMEGAAGFSKDVAIKLLSDRDPGEDVLQRFRDESRILGLIRDRAIVSVDPPTRLNGRWAVIMECVDGASARALLRAHGPMPVTVALEIVQEVARALDHVYHLPGPSGDALELVHRDLKPANLQLTAGGEVKILDFGTARARFEAREAETTRSIAGTYGYIAPERLHGVDTSAGDIYSLGMVLYRLLTARKADGRKLAQTLSDSQDARPDLHRALLLARDMCHEEPEDRPSAREVEDRCRALRSRLEGPDLRSWAPEAVKPVAGMDRDELVGKTLSATFALQTDEVTITRSRTRWLMLASLTGVNLLLVASAVVVVCLIAIGVVAWSLSREATVASADDPFADERAAIEAPEPVAAPEPPPEPAVEAVEGDAEVDGADATDGADEAEVPAVEPAPERPRSTRRAAPPEEPEAEPVQLWVSSAPLGLHVYIDGVMVGRTPIRGRSVPAGSHRMALHVQGGVVERDLQLGAGLANKFVWTGKSWREDVK